MAFLRPAEIRICLSYEEMEAMLRAYLGSVLSKKLPESFVIHEAIFNEDGVEFPVEPVEDEPEDEV